MTALADALRDASEEELLALLRARPDLATPPPATTAVLARRAGTMTSISRACDDLDRFTLTVFEALLVAGADTAPVAPRRIAGLLGPDVPGERLDEALLLLRSRGLAWVGEDGTRISVPPAAAGAVSQHPGALGRESGELSGTDVAAAIAALPEQERALLDRLSGQSPIGSSSEQEGAASPVGQLLAKGLLMRRAAETVELPRQVGFALRGEYPLGDVPVNPPVPATGTIDQETVDSAVAAEVLTLCRHVESMIESWSQDPPQRLRSGGIGVRELRRIAAALDVPTEHAALLTELLVASGLAAVDDTDGSEWVPTTHADGWLAAPPEHRWAELVRAWFWLPRLPGLAGTPDAKGKPIAALSDDLRRPLAPADRRRILCAVAELGEGTAATDREALVALLAWRKPRRGGRLRDELVRQTLAEATALGITATVGGTAMALGTAGRAMLHQATGATEMASSAGDEPERLMAAALPEPVEHVLIQADLTMVAPGPLPPGLAAEMALVADAESTGSATVYRVSEQSVRRALDVGRSSGDLHEFFRAHATTPVPQGLTYLIDDVARRHGRLRGGVAGSFLRCDHDVLLTEVLAHEVAGRLELRRIAPTVLVSPLPLSEVLSRLRGAGFAPAGEASDGTVLDLRPGARRVAAGNRAAGSEAAPYAPSGEALRSAARQARAGDRAESATTSRAVSPAPGSGTSATVASTLTVLRSAAREGSKVWLGVVDSRGTASQFVLTPVRVGGGALAGEDADGVAHTVPLHLVTSVALVTD